MGGRAHLSVDHSQPPDEPRLRVLSTDHGRTCLLVDDPINAQKAGQRNRMRASQTPSKSYCMRVRRARDIYSNGKADRIKPRSMRTLHYARSTRLESAAPS